MSAPSVLELNGIAGCCDDEEWKLVPAWPHHEASSCGQVRMLDYLDAAGRLRLGQMLPQHPDKRPGKGYLYVTLRDGQRRRKAAVAVLVLEAHRSQRPGPGYEACHNDGIRTDNHLARIRWDTREANLEDMARHRLERAVTERAGDLSPDPYLCHKLQVRWGAVRFRGLSQLFVTSDRPHGTGRFPLPFICPSFFSSLNPQTLRSLRSRRVSR